MSHSAPSVPLGEYLTVGQAAFLQVSPSTLRHRDPGGKLSPARHPLNGYGLYRRVAPSGGARQS